MTTLPLLVSEELLPRLLDEFSPPVRIKVEQDGDAYQLVIQSALRGADREVPPESEVVAIHRENDPSGEQAIFQKNLSALELRSGAIIYASNQLLDNTTGVPKWGGTDGD